MITGRFSVAHGVVMALAALAAAVQADLIAFTFTGSQVSSAFSVGETVTATDTLDSAAAPTSISSTQGLYNAAINSFNVTTSGGYVASAAEVPIAVSNGDLHGHDRYQAVVGESPPLFDLNAPDVNGIASRSFTISLFDRTDTAFADTSVPTELDLSRFDATDLQTATPVAFDFGSPNIEASFVRAISLSPEQEIVSGFEPRSILVFFVGVIGSALAGLALTTHKRTRWRSRSVTVQAGEIRRIRRRPHRRHRRHLRSVAWLAVFLPLLAFAYFLLFVLPKVL